MSTTGLLNTWDLFPNRTLGRVGKRERGGHRNEQSNFFSLFFGLLSSDMCRGPLHSCGGFEVLKVEGQKKGVFI